MKAAAPARAEIDLHDNGPLRRADGVGPRHFWPMGGDSYWYREFDRQYLLSATHLDWIGVIELNKLAGHGIARIVRGSVEVVTNAARWYARPSKASWDRPLPSDQYAAAYQFAPGDRRGQRLGA
jgi:hypothetical protein